MMAKGLGSLADGNAWADPEDRQGAQTPTPGKSQNAICSLEMQEVLRLAKRKSYTKIVTEKDVLVMLNF